MGAAERIEWQRESPALLRSDHPCDTVGDERETLLWWSQHPVLLWSEHPCDTAWDEIDPEICQSPANDNARLFLPLSGTTNTPTLVLRSKAISAGREKAAPSPATDQTTRTEEGSAPILDIFPLARAVMAEGSAAGARALGEEARPERRTRQGEAQPAQAQAALTYITFSDNRRAEQAGGWGLPQWPEGAKPVTKKIEYDDLYRATRIRYDYSEGDDTWKSPFQAEIEGNAAQDDPRRSKPSPHIAFQKRILQQTFEYDWLGNNEKTTDDASGFYDRSLGDISNDSSGGNPYQLKSATLPGESGGSLEARYDAAGNMTKMALQREGQCLGGATAGDCSQQFVYDWDEVGRLVRARRWDNNLDSVDAFDPTAGTPAADLRHIYDASDQRVIKEAVDAQGEQSFTLYVFATMELRRAQYGAEFAETQAESDYEVSHYTVVPYLMANGVRLARLVYHGSDEVPEEDASTDGSYGDVNASVSNLHVFFELGDHLGSTSVVLDKATGELVERATFQGYGGAESDYRPGRWKSFREDYRFTGKEEDVEVGLQYFGFRFLNPLLGRWISADPLEVHAPGGSGELNTYAYVSGAVLKNVDPLGLCDGNQSCEAVLSNADGSTGNSDGSIDNSSNVVTVPEVQIVGDAPTEEKASDAGFRAGLDAANALHSQDPDEAMRHWQSDEAKNEAREACGVSCEVHGEQFDERYNNGVAAGLAAHAAVAFGAGYAGGRYGAGPKGGTPQGTPKTEPPPRAQARAAGSAERGRAKNHLREDPSAEGRPHSVFRRDEKGTTTYETYNHPEPGRGKRVDSVGPPHGGVPTPHTVETQKHVNPKTGRSGYRESRPRPSTPDEVPKRKD